MKPPNDWSFPFLLSLRPSHLNLPACDTFAYWVLLVDAARAHAMGADDWVGKMSYQIDREGQAADADDFLSDPDIMPDIARPIAPVCFARLWSPLPMACAILGTPAHYQLATRGPAFATWTTLAKDTAIDERPADVAFFQSLLARAIAEARAERKAICLVGQVGWSYDDCSRFGFGQKRAMKKAGFLEYQNRPR